MLSSSFMPATPLVLVGAGKMGGALLAGWLAGGLDPKAVLVIDPSPSEETLALLAKARVRVETAPPEGLKAKVLLIAVKPQIMGSVLPGLRSLVGAGTIVVSIAAGTSIANLEAGLGPAAVVRTMPNTPAQVGRGITAAVPNDRVDDAGRQLVTSLLEAVGDVVWVESEGLIDAVTAVSGSGPAYVFLLAESLAEAGAAAGLPPETAARLARATVSGAGELLRQSDLPPSQLRKNVTSPGGTTAAALQVLMSEEGFGPLLTKAVAAAKKRSEELSG